MLKSGFRDERKRILTPSLSQGEGECSDGKSKETSPFTHTQLSLASSKGGIRDGKVEGNVVKISSFTHTPLSRTSLGEGECGDGKGKK